MHSLISRLMSVAVNRSVIEWIVERNVDSKDCHEAAKQRTQNTHSDGRLQQVIGRGYGRGRTSNRGGKRGKSRANSDNLIRTCRSKMSSRLCHT
jgi:hypothetical protein